MTIEGQKYIDKYSFKELSDEQLSKKSTQRLLQIYKRLRSRRDCAPNISNLWCSSHYCGCGWMGDTEQWNEQIKPVIQYFNARMKLIKSILATRENIK